MRSKIFFEMTINSQKRGKNLSKIPLFYDIFSAYIQLFSFERVFKIKMKVVLSYWIFYENILE